MPAAVFFMMFHHLMWTIFFFFYSHCGYSFASQLSSSAYLSFWPQTFFKTWLTLDNYRYQMPKWNINKFTCTYQNTWCTTHHIANRYSGFEYHLIIEKNKNKNKQTLVLNKAADWFKHSLVINYYRLFLWIRWCHLIMDHLQITWCDSRADSRFVPNQWETLLQSHAVSHWLGTNLESALHFKMAKEVLRSTIALGALIG